MLNPDKLILNEFEADDLEIVDGEGTVVRYPILAVFSAMNRNYVALHYQEGKMKDPEVLLVRLETKEDSKENYIQAITGKEEWDTALEAWEAIVARMKKISS